jgi:protein-S-isoprenylcysteine O-methyltransferase Ste14
MATELLPSGPADPPAPSDPRGEPRRPASATSFALNAVALVPVFAALYFLRHRYQEFEKSRLAGIDGMLVLLAAVSIPIVLLDVLVLRVYRRPSTGLDWKADPSPSFARVLTKLLGLALTIGLVALAYWVFPEYHGTFYDPLWNVLRRFGPALAILAVGYIWFVDGSMREPHDAYWQLGRVVLLHPEDARRFDVANHFRGWLVKAFFFPLMLVWLSGSVSYLVTKNFSEAGWSNLLAYDYLNSLIYGLDLLFTTAGYALSLRVIDTHIRTAEPTIYGWVVALFCYQPFYSLLERQYVSYGGFGFGDWLVGYPALRWIWAGAILALITVYTLATVAFGVRFSNLTHRGILTGGPYRFTKHPAYLTKNFSWWLTSIPFLHAPWQDAIRHSLALACINTIYFLRARTEERHLSRDPDYVAYALWMNEHGVLAFLGRLLPIFRYRAPAADEATRERAR